MLRVVLWGFGAEGFGSWFREVGFGVGGLQVQSWGFLAC